MRWIIFFVCFFLSVNLYARELVIQTRENELHFKTDIANTPELQQRGLMFKKSIPLDYAMTFLFEKPSIIQMWMKNTFIPLDMVFFDKTGTIVHLKENAIPHDLTTISSKVLAVGVIEMNAGLIEDKKIKIGDKIILK